MCVIGRWLYIVPLMLFASVALGAPYTYETVRTSPGAYTTTGVATPTTVKFTPPSASPRFYQMVPTATKNVVATTARAALRGGPAGWAAAAAVGAIVEGAGYLIDAAGNVKKVEVVYGPPSGSYYITDDSIWCQPRHLSDCAFQASTYTYTVHNENRDESRRRYWGWNCPTGYGVEIYEHGGVCFDSPPEQEENIIDLDPSDWEVLEDAWWNNLSPSQKSSLMQWAITDASPRGTVDTDNYPVTVTSSNPSVQTLYDNYPEFQTMLQQLLNAEIARWLALQDPAVELTEEEQRIVDTGSVTEPIPVETGESSELPAFCEWATFICEPFVSTPHPDVPTLDLEIEDFDSGLPGDSSCPAPYTFETAFTGPIEISFQPACDLAAAIRVPLLAISYLMAGFIVVGVRR